MNAKAIAICIATGVLRVTIIVMVLGRGENGKGFWICWLFYLPFSPAITVQVGLGLGAIKVRLTDSVVQCRAVQQQSVGLPVFQLTSICLISPFHVLL